MKWDICFLTMMILCAENNTFGLPNSTTKVNEFNKTMHEIRNQYFSNTTTFVSI